MFFISVCRTMGSEIISKCQGYSVELQDCDILKGTSVNIGSTLSLNNLFDSRAYAALNRIRRITSGFLKLTKPPLSDLSYFNKLEVIENPEVSSNYFLFLALAESFGSSLLSSRDSDHLCNGFTVLFSSPYFLHLIFITLSSSPYLLHLIFTLSSPSYYLLAQLEPPRQPPSIFRPVNYYSNWL